jgi:hypothetical protein
MWTAGGLMLTGVLIYLTLQVGSRHVEAEPIPRVD